MGNGELFGIVSERGYKGEILVAEIVFREGGKGVDKSQIDQLSLNVVALTTHDLKGYHVLGQTLEGRMLCESWSKKGARETIQQVAIQHDANEKIACGKYPI